MYSIEIGGNPVNNRGLDSGGSGGGNPVSVRVRDRFSEEFLAIFTGINIGLKSKDPKDFIIDAQVVDLPRVGSLTGDEGIRALNSFVRRVSQQGIHRFPQYWSVALDSALVTARFLSERSKDPQDRTAYPELYYAISGDILLPTRDGGGELRQPIRIDDIELVRGEYLSLLAFSENFDPEDENSIREAESNFHNAPGKPQTPDQVEQQMKRFRRGFLHQLAERLRITPEELAYDFSFRWVEDETGTYNFWERGEPEGFVLVSNLSRIDDLDIAAVEQFDIHEDIGHFAMLHRLRQRIQKGEIDRVMGILPIPDRRSWMFEGIAQKVTPLAGLEVTRDGKLSEARYEMNKLARAYAVLKIKIEGADLEDTVTEIMRYYPNQTREVVAKDIKTCTEDFFWSLYSPIYGTSALVMRNIRDIMGPDGALQVLREAYNQPMVPAQLGQLSINRFLQSRRFQGS